MKVKELIELLEKTEFITKCITDKNLKTEKDEEFRLKNIGNAKNGYEYYKDRFLFEKDKTIMKFDSLKQVKENEEIMESEIISIPTFYIHQFREHYWGFDNYYNDSYIKFIIK